MTGRNSIQSHGRHNRKGRIGRQAIAAMWLRHCSHLAAHIAGLIRLISARPVSRFLSASIEHNERREMLISDIARENDSSAHHPSFED